MKRIILILLLCACNANSQVKIGDNATTVNQSAVLELESTDKGLILPRVTDVSLIANPVTGMIVFDLTNNCVRVYVDDEWSGCLSESSNSGSSSSNGTSEVLSYNCSGISTGYMTVGEPVTNVSQVISVTVAEPGTYAVSATANGVTFSGAGTWSAAGTYNLTLQAWGTPLVAETTTFNLNTVPGCNFTRQVGKTFSGVPCSTSYSSFPVSVNISSQNIIISKSGTNSSGSSDEDCGITTSSSSAVRLYFGQSATFQFSTPLQNVQCYMGGANGSQDDEGVTATAYLNNIPVAVQIVPFAGCTDEFDVFQSGNSGILKCNTNNSYDSATIFNISSETAYDTVVLSRNSTQNGGSIYLELMFCNTYAP